MGGQQLAAVHLAMSGRPAAVTLIAKTWKPAGDEVASDLESSAILEDFPLTARDQRS